MSSICILLGRKKNYVVALMPMALTLKGNYARLLSNDYKDVWVL